MKTLALGLTSLALFVSPALAQGTAPAVQVGDTGLVAPALAKTATAVVNEKPKLRKMNVGASCKFHEGDTFKVVGIQGDGSVIVTRALRARLAQPDSATCPSGVALKVPAALAEAAVLAQKSADAAKAKAPPKKS